MVHEGLQGVRGDAGVRVTLGVGLPVSVGVDLRLVERQHLGDPSAFDLDHGGDEEVGQGLNPGPVTPRDPAGRDGLGTHRVRQDCGQQGERRCGRVREPGPRPFLLGDDHRAGRAADRQPAGVPCRLVVVVDQRQLAVGVPF